MTTRTIPEAVTLKETTAAVICSEPHRAALVEPGTYKVIEVDHGASMVWIDVPEVPVFLVAIHSDNLDPANDRYRIEPRYKP